MPCFILILPSGATNLFTLSTCRCCSVAKMCPTLCGLMESSLPSSSVHGISQAQILEWVAVSSSRGSSWPWDQTCASYIAGIFFTAEPPGKPPSNMTDGPSFEAHYSVSTQSSISQVNYYKLVLTVLMSSGFQIVLFWQWYFICTSVINVLL